MAYLKLFRWQNLLVVALTQYILRYAIVIPILAQYEITPALSHIDFFLLVLTTLLLCAAGYAINDYFDLRTDRINKPEKIVLGRKISRRIAILLHTFLNVIGVLLGFYISWKVGNLHLAGIFVVVPIILWMYSVRYKKRFFAGNLIVSVLAALVATLVWIFDSQALSHHNIYNELAFNTITQFVRIYALFAFLATLGREIIKDIEDIKGDAKTGCKTIPIISGIRSTKRLVIVVTLALMVFVGYFMIYILRKDFDFAFAFLVMSVQIPLVLMLNKIHIAKIKADYSYLSKFSKFIMLNGILAMLLISYYIQQGLSLL